ncbi:MAG: cation:dicarboxylase symporter family transporter [Pseudomonadota bacterium]
MRLLERLSHSSFALLLCLLAGGAVGAFLPEVGRPATLLGQLYLAVVSMAAIPLLVVATFFGLRQTMRLPHPARRVFMMACFAFLLVAAAAAAGTVFGVVLSPGNGLSADARAHLGAVVQKAGGEGDELEMDLYGVAAVQHNADHPLSGMFPNNFFHELVEGHALGILSCAIIFGMAFAMARPQNGSLDNLLEGIYRTLELIISRANLMLPVLAFSVAAHLMAETDKSTLRAMGGFIGCFIFLVVLLSFGALVIIGRRSGQPLAEVARSLKAPMLVSLASASSTASIPFTIAALSERLGFSRGVVELIVPTSSVFLRAGTALYTAVLVIFVANLYDRPVGLMGMGLVCLGSIIAAFASAGYNSVASVGFAGMVLNMLQLPVEAALTLFIAIDLLCEGPRNLLTLLASCVLTAIVSAGLPSERVVAVAEVAEGPREPLRFAFTRLQLGLVLGCCTLVAALILLLGVGVGSKSLRPHGVVQHVSVYEYGAMAPGGLQ